MGDILTEFAQASFDRQLELVDDPAHQAALTEMLGVDGLASMRALPRADAGVLAAKPAPNTLFVPGVMGSVLSPAGLGGVWWLDVRARKELNRLGLNREGSDDAEAGIDVQPTAIDYSYSEFMAHGLAHDHVSVRGGWYDWRRRLTDSVDRIVGRVDELRASNGGQPVHLVGHSMGGLIIRTALMERPVLWDKIGRIAFIGTPHHGSPAIASYLKGHLWGTEPMAILGLYLSRATFQTLMGPLSLLPAPLGIYPNNPQLVGEHPCANFDLYDADAYELDFGGDADRRDALQARLDSVADHWRRLAAHQAGLSSDQQQRLLMIIGVGHETIFRLERDGSWFGRKDKKLRERSSGDPHREGDGRVPQASATLNGVAANRYVNGVHGELPNIPAVAATVFEWVTAGTVSPQLATSAAEALDTGHLGGGPLAPVGLQGADGVDLYADDRVVDELTDDERAALMAKLESGQIPRFELTKIL